MILFLIVIYGNKSKRTLGVHSQFVHTIANLTLDTIDAMFDYGKDHRLQNLNLRDLVEFVRKLSIHNHRVDLMSFE